MREPGGGFTMPYSHTTADYMVPLGDIDWYRELRARVDAGQKLLLVYNLTSYEENATNPTAILHRLYVHLGHEAFRRSVFAFGDVNCVWVCLPVRPLAQLNGFVAGITDPETFTGSMLTHPGDPKVFRKETGRILEAIRKRFTIQWESGARGVSRGSSRWAHFRLKEGPSPGADPTSAGPLARP
jgi:hypothetical protein